jgi:hypothetical protein
MRMVFIIQVAAIALALTACNKASPPPQEPVKPRGLMQIETPLPLPTP